MQAIWLLLAPVDRVGWTKSLEDKFFRFNKAEAASKKGLRITGQLDEESRNQFVQKGWKVMKHAGDVLLKNNTKAVFTGFLDR